MGLQWKRAAWPRKQHQPTQPTTGDCASRRGSHQRCEYCLAKYCASLSSHFYLKVCGYAHTLAVTDEGALYAWGANSYGQLGTGNKANSCTPTKVGEDLGRIVEVSATHYNHISAALTQDSRCYMWGQCRGQSVVSPTETPFTSLHDVFACFATPSVTFIPMETEVTNGPSVYDSLKLAFDDPHTSDVRFLVRRKKGNQIKMP